MAASSPGASLDRLLGKNTESIEQLQDEYKRLSAAFDELRNDNAQLKVFQDQIPSLVQLEVRQAVGQVKRQMMSGIAERNRTDQFEEHDGTRHIHGPTVKNAVAGQSAFAVEGGDEQPVPTNMSTPETRKRNYDARSPVTDTERREWASMWISEQMRMPLDDYVREKRAELKGSETLSKRRARVTSNDKSANMSETHRPQLTSRNRMARAVESSRARPGARPIRTSPSDTVMATTEAGEPPETPIKYSPSSRNDRKLKVGGPDGSEAVKKDTDHLPFLLDSFKPRKEKKGKK